MSTDPLHDERARLVGLIDSAMDAVVTVNEEQRITLFNPAAERMFDCAAAAVIGAPLVQLMPQRFRAGHSEHVRRFGVGGVSNRRLGAGFHQVYGLRANGEEFPIEVSISQLVVGGQKFYSAILRDVTERRLAERALTESETRLRAITDSLAEGLVVSSLQGQLVFWNAASRVMLGFTSAGNVLHTLPEFFETFEFSTLGGRVLKLEESPLSRILAGESLRGLELFVRRFGFYRRLILSFSGSVVKGEMGEPVAFLSFADITDRKRTEEEIRELNTSLEARVRERTAELTVAKERADQANRAKSEFLANMSHELRTPLTSIIGFTGILLMRVAGPLTADQEKQLATVEANAHRLLSLINDLLDLGKVESGKLVSHIESVSCHAVIEEVVASLQPLAAAKGLAFHAKLSAEDIVLQTDRRVLSQIIVNLANNAIKFTEHGSVGIELAQRMDGGCRLTDIRVIDTGIGIEPKDQARLFQAFTQLDASASRSHEGTGLGLHLSRKFAELIHARIHLTSERGVGSTFVLTIAEG